MYCVYKTTYFGSNMPKYYIGSTSIEKIEKGYKGSVKSRKWKDIWLNETENYPELFHVEILSVHETREEALQEELKLQKLYDVVKSNEWINESYAQVNGFFGRDTSGKNNPMYGKAAEVASRWARENPEKASERSRKAAKKQWSDPEKAKKKCEAMRGKKKTRKTQTQEEFLAMQKAKFDKAREKTMKRIEYNGKIYIGWDHLKKETGLSSYRYKKYYLNNTKEDNI